MGKSLPPASTNLQGFARIASDRLGHARLAKPVLKSLSSPKAARSGADCPDQSTTRRGMEAGPERREERIPLSEVVSDCVRRWFQDALKEARAGDVGMQVLVGQMYYSGYGVARNVQKGKAWISKASRIRSSVWKVSDKHPGYNASDSDSDELKDDVK